MPVSLAYHLIAYHTTHSYYITRGYPNLDRYPNLDTGGIAKKKMLLLA